MAKPFDIDIQVCYSYIVMIENLKHRRAFNVAHDTPERLRTFHLFAGAGGGILADLLLGHIPVGACEIEPYPRAVLLQRQRDGILPEFPIWDDVRTLDGKPWRGCVDVVAGGFPCQDISAAGKGAGIEGERSGLWGEFARIIGEVRPRFAFVENSPMLTIRGLGTVLGDLAALGYDADWCVLGACDAGAPHWRERIWILAHAESECGDVRRLRQPTDAGGVTGTGADIRGRVQVNGERTDWWHAEPDVGRVADGVANRVDRLKAIGNGQVPAVASLAWNILMGKINGKTI